MEKADIRAEMREEGILRNIQEVKLTSQGDLYRQEVRDSWKSRMTPKWHQGSG